MGDFFGPFASERKTTGREQGTKKRPAEKQAMQETNVTDSQLLCRQFAQVRIHLGPLRDGSARGIGVHCVDVLPKGVGGVHPVKPQPIRRGKGLVRRVRVGEFGFTAFIVSRRFSCVQHGSKAWGDQVGVVRVPIEAKLF